MAEEALTIPSAALVQEFLTAKGKEVVKPIFYGFDTARIVRKFDGITDKLILAEQDVTKTLIKEWNKTLSPTEDAIEVTDWRLEVAQMKTELEFVMRSEEMRAYKAYLKGAGMSTDDMHFLDYLLMQPIEKQQTELEDAIWQAEEQPSGIGLRSLMERVNGYRKIAKDAAAAGKATTVATGAITESNAVAKVEQFYRGAHKNIKKLGLHTFCSFDTFEKYQINYRDTYKVDSVIQEVKGMDYTFEGVRLNLGAGRSYLIPVAGFGDDDALIGTRREFLAFGFDYESELGNWDVQRHGWITLALNAFTVGFQIMLKRPGYLLVNDRL
jgi:hypothetical protein